MVRMMSAALPSAHDFVVVGGGIVGMATAWQLQKTFPDKSVLVLEKEPGLAMHQTGRNSGVIHAGVYYTPGSLKARFCRLGNQATKSFCREHGIPFDECGKLVVATDSLELERMQALIERCARNGISIEVLDQSELQRREPNITGIGAIFVPSTGIVDFARVCSRMGDLVRENGGLLQFGCKVKRLVESDDTVTLTTTEGDFTAKYVIACTGLQSDRMARMAGMNPGFRVVPFRGEYYRLGEQHNDIVKHLIYPVPDPGLPFLGVHLTRMIDGSVTVGPNAVISFKREGYRSIDFSITDTVEMLTYFGTIRALSQHFLAGMSELKDSMFKAGYLKRVQKYCPKLRRGDLLEYPPGVRAQAVSSSGELIDDFLFMNTARCLVVCNAPSPAATSAIPIGEHIVQKLGELIAGPTSI